MANILHIVRYPYRGGAEILVANIINTNRHTCFNHFLLYTNDGPLLSMINSYARKYLIKCNYKNHFSFIRALRHILINYEIDIIHTHQPVDAVYSVFAGISLNIKIFRTYHGFGGRKRPKGGKWKQILINYLMNRFITMNIFVSYETLNYYRSVNPSQLSVKQIVLHNGIIINDIEKGDKNKIRKELSIPEGHALLGMIGSFSTNARDQYTICRALLLTMSTIRDLHFLFIGRTTGKNIDMFSRCLEFCTENNMLNNVHFLGERNDIFEILGELDLYVHSSNYETFGLSLIEAMAAGIPVIASDIPAFREISKNGTYITLFKPGDEVELNNMILTRVNKKNSDEVRKKLSEARNYVINNFSIQDHLKKLHSYYSECLK